MHWWKRFGYKRLPRTYNYKQTWEQEGRLTHLDILVKTNAVDLLDISWNAAFGDLAAQDEGK